MLSFFDLFEVFYEKTSFAPTMPILKYGKSDENMMIEVTVILRT